MSELSTASDHSTADDHQAERAFSRSVVISGIRCTLAYVVVPFAFPLIGLSSSVGPWIGIPIGLAALVANLASIQRFHRSQHRLRWPMTVINVGIIGLVTVLLALDFIDLAGRIG